MADRGADAGTQAINLCGTGLVARGAELILTKVIPDDMVRGFEHHSFICSECHVADLYKTWP
jgi:hypothetical protein